ncbi:MAG: DUF2341 domain-containing protein [Candidatus Thorarchaeota archaeon]
MTRVNFKTKTFKASVILFLFSFQVLSLIPSFVNNSNIHDQEEYNNNFKEKNVYTSLAHPNDAYYFRYYKNITINHEKVNGTGIHSNFPVLISIIDGDLHYYTQHDGDDIAFCIGNTWLDHEIEMYNKDYSATQAKLVVWVRIPSLSTSNDTTLKMFFGNSTMNSRQNPAVVWNINYKGIWHFGETSGNVQDSTSYGNEGIHIGGVTQGTVGKIGKANNFDGIDDYINLGNPIDDHLNFGTGSLTFSIWVEIDSGTGDFQDIIYKGSTGSTDPGYSLATNVAATKIEALVNDGVDRISSTYVDFSVGQWIYYVITINRSDNLMRYYKDGTLSATPVDISMVDDISSTKDLTLSRSLSYIDGSIDEFRLSNVAHSSGWIATEYNNQNDPDNFYSIGVIKEVHPLRPEYFNFYKIITIDHTKVAGTNDLVNFPLLVSLTDPDLKDQVQPDGDDIVFAQDGNWLDHEIELLDQNFNPYYGKLVAWVRIPILYYSIDTEIYMYYGNSTMRSQQNPVGVWDSNYKGVWHLSELSGYSKDSTSYGTEGVPTGGVAKGKSGISGYAYDFDGITGTKLDYGDPVDEHLDVGPGSFTISIWVNFDQNTGTFQMPLYKGGSSDGNEGYSLEINNALNAAFYTSNGTKARGVGWPHITLDRWSFLVGVVNRLSGKMSIYFDGNFVNEQNVVDGSLSSDETLKVSNNYSPVDGIIDEPRICNVARSNSWIATEYNNQYNPDTFYSVSYHIHVSRPRPEYFNFYKVITIDHNKVSGTTNLVNFPLLISLEDSDLKDQVQSDGDDIAFWNGSGWLDHEIEFFDQNFNPNYGKLVAWVRIPILYYYKDTTIYMYYGNHTLCSQESSNGVWDNDFNFVLHMNQDPTVSDILDSSSNGFDFNVETGGGMTSNDLVDGQTGKAIAFDGNDDFIYLPRSEDFSGSTDKMTFEFWLMLPNGVPAVRDTLARPARTTRSPHLYFLQEFNFEIETSSTSTVKSAESFQTVIGRWVHFACVWDGTGGGVHQIFINGTLNNEDSTPLTGTHVDWDTISIGTDDDPTDGPGGNADSARFLEVTLSEFRLSKVVRSADWIATEYNNQYDTDSFYSISARIHVRRPIPEDYQYLKMIFIDHNKVSGSSDLINFPILISINDEDLHDDVQPDGDDIAFWNGTVWLDHEIELFDQNYNSTHAQLITWVRIPQLRHDEDTLIYMYYGNSTLCSQESSSGVWDSNYVGVWHLLESNGDAVDSTIYREHGAISGAVEQSSSGKINSAYNFYTDGTVNVGDPVDGHLDFDENTDFTVSFWLNIDTTTTVKQRPLYKGGSSLSDGGYNFETSTSGDLINFYVCDEISRVGSYSAPITYDQWTYITGVVDRKNDYIYIYKDNSVITGGVSLSSVGGSLKNDVNLQFPWENSYLDGLIDEVRISNIRRSTEWIATEYNSQNDPESFFSIGPEIEVGEVNVEVHVVDLYGNYIPNLNVTMTYNSIIYNVIANDAGIAMFENVSKIGYNFTVEMTSDIGTHSVIVNKTTQPIVIDEPLEIVNLICNVSTNFIEVRDLDDAPVNSGWIIVGNSSHNLQNCTIEETGHSRFWWVNNTPYNYNFTVYYRDEKYNPSTANVGSGDISMVNSTIFATARLTTVNFSVNTEDTTPIGGARLILNYTHTLENAINLTTDVDGKATFRWLNTTNLYNYSLKIIFLGKRWNFDISGVTPGFVSEFDLSISSSTIYNIVIKITQSEIEEYETYYIY